MKIILISKISKDMIKGKKTNEQFIVSQMAIKDYFSPWYVHKPMLDTVLLAASIVRVAVCLLQRWQLSECGWHDRKEIERELHKGYWMVSRWVIRQGRLLPHDGGWEETERRLRDKRFVDAVAIIEEKESVTDLDI